MKMFFWLMVGTVLSVAGCTASSPPQAPNKGTAPGILTPFSAVESTSPSITSPSITSTWAAPIPDYDGIGYTDPEELIEAYEQGFQDACGEIWSNSPDGVLYYDEDGYTQDDCESEMDIDRAYDTFDANEALDMGREDAIESAFNLSPIEHLCWGTECWGPEDY